MELLVQSGPDAGKVFQVGTNPLVAGRQAGTDILLNDGQASRRHASFELVNGTLMVSDLGSANGTQVNGQPLGPNQPRPLAPGDTVTIGGTSFVLRGAAPGPSPVVTQPTQSYQQVAPPPPAYNPPPPPSNYNPAPPAYNQPPAYNPPVQPQQPPAQPYNQPPAYGAPVPQPAGYNQPVGGYNQPGEYGAIAPAYGQIPAPSPGYGYAPPPPTTQPKKGRGGLFVGLGVIVVIAIAAVVGIIVVAGGNNSTPAPANGTPVAQVSVAPIKPVPPATVPVGQSGTNVAPPSPPAATTAAAPTPTPASQTKTPGTGTSTDSATSGLGLTITFPADWKTQVNENKNLIESDAPDGVTYSLVLRIAGVKGAATDRLKKYITAITENEPDLKIVQDVKAGESSDQVADAIVTYTDQNDNLQHRDYVVAVANGSSSGDTYFMTFSTEDSKFDSQFNTFSTILRSIKF